MPGYSVCCCALLIHAVPFRSSVKSLIEVVTPINPHHKLS
jgi:hypothetical protein